MIPSRVTLIIALSCWTCESLRRITRAANESQIPFQRAFNNLLEEENCCCKAVSEHECDFDHFYHAPFCCRKQNKRCRGSLRPNKKSFKISAAKVLQHLSLYPGSTIDKESDLCTAPQDAPPKCASHVDCPAREACTVHARCKTKRCREDIRCRAGHSQTCKDMLNNISFALVLTSAGGGGHLVAARGLSDKYNAKVKAKIEALEAECGDEMQRDGLQNEFEKLKMQLNTKRSFIPVRMQGVQVKDEKGHVFPEYGKVEVEGFTVTMNVMYSDCTKFPERMKMVTNLAISKYVAENKGHAGIWMAEQWSGLMREGKFEDLEDMMSNNMLYSAEVSADWMMQCTDAIVDVVNTARSAFFWNRQPAYFIDTQPLKKLSINKAAKNTGATSVHLYITDFPSDECRHFTLPLNRLARKSRWAKKNFIVHVPEADPKMLKKWFGGLTLQTESNLPVDPQFNDENLRLPGEAVKVTLKAQVKFNSSQEVVSEAETYEKLGGQSLGTQSFSFQIEPETSVGLIMLGSEPPGETVVRMAQVASELGIAASKAAEPGASATSAAEVAMAVSFDQRPKFQAILFVACGRARENTNSDGLYAKVMKIVLDYEQRLADEGLQKRLTIVPFSGQPALVMYARSDWAVIKTGGLSAAEGLSLGRLDKRVRMSQRGTKAGQKEILMSAWSSSPEVVKAVKKSYKIPIIEKDWQVFLADHGNVAHEGGNALYLLSKPDEINALSACVRPTAEQVMTGTNGKISVARANRRASMSAWEVVCERPFKKTICEALFNGKACGIPQ